MTDISEDKNHQVSIVYPIGFLVLCLSGYLLWGGYQLYLIKNPPVYVGNYSCSPQGECKKHTKTFIRKYCSISFLADDCSNQCDKSINFCSR